MQTDTIKTAIKQYKQAKARYGKAFNKWFQTLPLLPDKRFWILLAEYQKLFVNSIPEVHYCGNNSVQLACDEFFRRSVVRGNWPRYTLIEAINFVKNYERLAGLLYEAGDNCDFSFERTDDPYGDLMDSLPLAGQEVCERLLGGKYQSLIQFTKHIGQVCSKKLAKAILEGENYNTMHLLSEARRRLAAHALP